MKFCVIGLGRFGMRVAMQLAENGMEVLAVDSSEQKINSIRDHVTQAICITVVDEESLRVIGVEEFDTIVVAMGQNFSQSILITALLKKNLSIPTVIARSTSKVHSDILKLVGADKVVSPEREQGTRLANSLSYPFIDLVNITDTFAITRLIAPEIFVGKSLAELELRETRRVTCVGVQKGNKMLLTGPDYVILEGDKLVIAGETHYLEALTRI
jgi:trk system potassium uptake protein TrkA